MVTVEEPQHKEAQPSRQSIEISIIGGPHDRITTVLEEFEPGQKEFIYPLESFGVAPRTITEISNREVEVTVPARLHPTVLDMNRFNLNNPGGGGLGFAIQVYLHAKVRATKSPDIIVNGERSLLMRHYGHIFQQVLDYPGGFEIELHDHERRHIGMGSSIGSMVAMAIGINEVLGRPFNGRELRRIIGYHSCEESPTGNNYLIPAFETGMGAMAGLNGGWVLGTDDLEMAYRVPLEDTKCVVFIPDVPSLEDEFTGKDTAAESEAELLLRRARYLDSLQSGVKAKMLLCDMLPAMIRDDLKAIGDTLFDLTFLGSKRAECEQHGSFGAPIYSYLSTFREIGVEVTGMSSVGPTIFTLTRNEETHERVLKYLRSQDIPESRIIDTAVDNVGARITENGAESPFQSKGWLHG
ncbi:MAG: sugar kinase [Gammaproteobacteria bacterium]|jgi:beta-ribofuranosylaminobenzene 5'-phosphate synthase|nr:sugar kinase [Gammaproteobacteria bacterium]